MSDDASDEYNKFVFNTLVKIRGGVPEQCDFCDQNYIEGTRWPIPEEAGAWACNECLARWGEG